MAISYPRPGKLISRNVSWFPSLSNKTWKILAIVGIVIACIIGLWILGSLLRCCAQGVGGCYEFCFFCSPRSKQRRSAQRPIPQSAPYSAPMVIYQPIMEPKSTYYHEVHYDLESQRPSYAPREERYEFGDYPAHSSRKKY
ncbi:LAFA_0C06612g1_1 [Lachancea sp. 'fantastica']|nr:LAFA_0C06612g1_1 [Lachancea sp. 'fantastica']